MSGQTTRETPIGIKEFSWFSKPSLPPPFLQGRVSRTGSSAPFWKGGEKFCFRVSCYLGLIA